jgi:hypothetical protein
MRFVFPGGFSFSKYVTSSVEVNSTLSGSTGGKTIARALKALLNSELGHSRPRIGAQAATYAYQEKIMAQLAIGPTQKVLRSEMGILPLISPTSA